ncbi:hypothetical protein [Bradyrhizobium sp. JYMT SZCCT0428]|uniref:hypothetical protein n=1 Tax=Bradyrhizobium sp. JYMT SZCCT0428 TaxID=2807673 RepID=UPI002012C3CC|nr:hypothetical protein [Bradyrhizobium sp. JYMT SZCCT0428]
MLSLFVIVVGVLFFGIGSSEKTSKKAPEDEWVSKNLCKEGIKQRATHPSTVDIHGFLGYATNMSKGTRYTKLSFDAKNGYGLTLKYEAKCIIDSYGHLDISIAERDY